MIALIPLNDGKKWMMHYDFVYNDIVVPAGFITDFASIPRPFYNLIPRWGKYGVATIVHDYLYATKKMARKEADAVLFEIMDKYKVAAFQKYAIYWGVRIFGWFVWKFKKYKK